MVQIQTQKGLSWEKLDKKVGVELTFESRKCCLQANSKQQKQHIAKECSPADLG